MQDQYKERAADIGDLLGHKLQMTKRYANVIPDDRARAAVSRLSVRTNSTNSAPAAVSAEPARPQYVN